MARTDNCTPSNAREALQGLLIHERTVYYHDEIHGSKPPGVDVASRHKINFFAKESVRRKLEVCLSVETYTICIE